MGSALLLVIVVGWAWLLLPAFVRRYDHVQTYTAVRRSPGMRVLVRRTPPPRHRRYVVRPRRLGLRRRRSRRVIARRRRALTLLAAGVLAGVFLGALVSPVGWLLAGGVGGLTVDFLVSLRRARVRTVRRRRAADAVASARGRAAPAAAPPTRRSVSQWRASSSPPAAAPVLDRSRIERATADSSPGAGWQPRPVPLPTYLLRAPVPRPAGPAELPVDRPRAVNE